MKSSPALRRRIILDACCIINLYASGEMKGIVDCLPETIAVASYVIENEILNVYDGPPGNVRSIKRKIDLNPLLASDSLHAVSLENIDELQTYVNLAFEMDDGEAITGAIAICRDWAIGTDDKKAINFFTKNEPQVPILSTLEFIKYWVDTTGPMTGLVQNVLQNVRMKARYEPDKNHSLYDWWHMFANLS